jgi:hypothetical protein
MDKDIDLDTGALEPQDDESLDANDMPIPFAKHERIPEAVYKKIQEAGKLAVDKLVGVLKDPAEFAKFKPTEKLAAIRLAMDRAYGLPDAGVKRQITVTMNPGSRDAIQASLDNLTKAKFPELRGVIEGDFVDVTDKGEDQ